MHQSRERQWLRKHRVWEPLGATAAVDGAEGAASSGKALPWVGGVWGCVRHKDNPWGCPISCLCSPQVLLVSSSRHPDRWIVPGGGMEPEEEPGVAAVREVCEEVSAFTLPCQPGSSGFVFIALPSSP